MNALPAQQARQINFQAWSIGDWLIAIIALAGAIAVTYIILGVFEVKIPDWIVKIFWVVLAVAIGIIAIRFILNL